MRIKWNINNPPDEREYYLITNQYGRIMIGYWNNINPLGNEGFSFHWDVPGDPYSEVVAWMPLPEPYSVTNM